MANALYAVIESDRIVSARQVVHRLQDEEEVIRASEHWQDEKALSLPAQMFRMGAEMVAKKRTRLVILCFPVGRSTKKCTSNGNGNRWIGGSC